MPHLHLDGDTSIDYAVTGSGRPLLLVHGITESRRTWDPLIGPLVAAGHRVIAVDLRGHGGSRSPGPFDLASMAGDVSAVAPAEDATDAVLVGHSLGGAVVSACAAGGLGAAVVNVDQPLALGGFKAALAQIEPQLRGDREAFVAALVALFDEMAGPLPEPERSRVAALRTPVQEVVLGVWEPVLTASVAELDATIDALARSITVPYLAVHGIDPGAGYAGWLTQRVATATVEVWPDHGHYPHLVDPERFVRRIAEHTG